MNCRTAECSTGMSHGSLNGRFEQACYWCQILLVGDGMVDMGFTGLFSGNNNSAGGFARLILRLDLDESKQTLVFLCSSKKLEGDAARAYRMYHPGQFKRRFGVVKG